MKVSKAQAAENRATLIAIASQRLRSGGFEAMATGDIAKAAALTHGALYSHFKSKEGLTAEALSEAFRECHEDFSKLDAKAWFEQYLSPQHRDAPDMGCPMAALVSEVPHQSDAIQRRFAAGSEAFIALASENLGRPNEASVERREQGLFMIAAMMGGLALSRALKTADPMMSEAVLTVIRKQLEEYQAG
ncbi:TetR/AcrR family transcriptional regulator [Rhizobium laguerreae]|uniref:TetR/AcrR family transcriptional regulator n=1 Tax=Rhizobium laguerreae TaxID=1076926 RepID=A0AB35FDJ7_9HYPH|nr:TetR/AcrR family transcriptional regulator [Rhizobium laguerreae]MBY3064782.1 TetR/AcrR family transcriptional regulator [Rhizobium laguerreae]